MNISIFKSKKKSTAELIEQIHQDFYTEVDKMKKNAAEKHDIQPLKNQLLNKAERLTVLGFTNSKEVQEAKSQKKRIKILEKLNQEKDRLLEVINYFSFRYPNYKLITKEAVKRICAKYNLIHGPVNCYKGVVPEKNLRHIEQFVVKDNDKPVLWYEDYSETRFGEKYVRRTEVQKLKESLSQEYEKSLQKIKQSHKDDPEHVQWVTKCYDDKYRRQMFDELPLEIAAPLKDFDTKNMSLRDFELKPKAKEIPDPVVLQPVFYGGEKYYLVVTAWGDEASDPEVVNQKLN